MTTATARSTTFPGSDYYVIELGEYTAQFHPDLPPTMQQVDMPHHFLGRTMLRQMVVQGPRWLTELPRFLRKATGDGLDGGTFAIHAAQRYGIHLEQRDDLLRSVISKRKKSVGRQGWTVLPLSGLSREQEAQSSSCEASNLSSERVGTRERTL